MNSSLTNANIRGVLLDIEGTTTPISFVHEILFPYARAHVRDYLTAHSGSAETFADLSRLREEHAADLARNLSPPPLSQEPRSVELDSIAAYVHWLIDLDRKSPGLKSLQGRIWQKGYLDGSLKAPLFADVVPALLVLVARVKISTSSGEKLLPLESVFLGPGKTVMERGDILTEIIIPPASVNLRGEYIKFSPREMMDLAYVGVAVALVTDGDDNVCREAVIALGAVAPVPMRARRAEAVLINNVINEESAERAGVAASDECAPISDVRSSAAYRRHMVRVNTKRAILNAASGRPENLPWLARRERRY